MMPPILLVMLGGACGAALRYLVSRWTFAAFGPGYPAGTLTVNVFGGFAMGMLAGVLARMSAGEPWRLLLGVGVLGGFTTFSSFSLELYNMLTKGDLGTALGYALLSMAGALVALSAGVALVRVVAA